MFSANFCYPLQSEDKVTEAMKMLEEQAKNEEGKFNFEFKVEGTKILANVNAASSENLRIAINYIFPVMEKVIPVSAAEENIKDDEENIDM